MDSYRKPRLYGLAASLVLLVAGTTFVTSQGVALIDPVNELPEALTGDQSLRMIAAVDRGLAALGKLQLENGEFKSVQHGQPAVTALAVMAFLSRGHKPGEGPYGDALDKGINYVLSHQQKSGLFSTREIDPALINQVFPEAGPYADIVYGMSYSHPICMLMLGEVFGLTGEQRAFRLRNAIDRGLKLTIQLWDIRKTYDEDVGGFRYIQPHPDRREGDLSLTSWHAVSLRSIRNAGFDVPEHAMNRIKDYVLRTQKPNGSFSYRVAERGTYVMTGAGMLCLSLAGNHDDPSLKKGALYLSTINVSNRRHMSDNDGGGGRFWPYYTSYYLTQASSQLGGRLWLTCMRQVNHYLIQKQHASGLWMPDGAGAPFGPSYSTSMAIIALTPELQLLPIYQR